MVQECAIRQDELKRPGQNIDKIRLEARLSIDRLTSSTCIPSPCTVIVAKPSAPAVPSAKVTDTYEGPLFRSLVHSGRLLDRP